MQLIKKIFIEGKIELKTGLHVGGSSTALDIGGIDSNVIKNANGVPYIPGSSIKGKIRSLLELKYSQYTQLTGFVDNGKIDRKKLQEKGIKENDNELMSKFNNDIQKLFGSVAKESDHKTRIIVRDAFLDKKTKSDMENQTGDFVNIELDYTEGKWENTIDRLTSAANPRQLERVPAGAKFDFSIVFTFYEESDNKLLKMFVEGMQLLQDDYLGGSGSRGYGQIEFKEITIREKTTENYKELTEGNKKIEKMDLKSINIDNLKL